MPGGGPEGHLRASSRSAAGWKRKPPLKGPRLLSCWTRQALKAAISPLSSVMTSSEHTMRCGASSSLCRRSGKSSSVRACTCSRHGGSAMMQQPGPAFYAGQGSYQELRQSVTPFQDYCQGRTEQAGPCLLEVEVCLSSHCRAGGLCQLVCRDRICFQGRTASKDVQLLLCCSAAEPGD